MRLRFFSCRVLQRGFSLIEMLVSLMITGIVLAILYQMVFFGLNTVQHISTQNTLRSNLQNTFVRLENIFKKLTVIQNTSSSTLLVFETDDDLYRLELAPNLSGYGLFLQKNTQDPSLLLYPVKQDSLRFSYLNQEGLSVTSLSETSFLEIKFSAGDTFSIPIDSGFYLENTSTPLILYSIE